MIIGPKPKKKGWKKAQRLANRLAYLKRKCKQQAPKPYEPLPMPAPVVTPFDAAKENSRPVLKTDRKDWEWYARASKTTNKGGSNKD